MPTLLEQLQAIPHWLVLSLMTVLLSFVATGLAFYVSTLLDLAPQIRKRDVHTKRKPRVGGVAMLLAFLTASYLYTSVQPGIFSFGQSGGRPFLGILLGVCIILITGLIDDIKGLKPWQQMIGQFLAGLVVVGSGVQVELIRLPFMNDVMLNVGKFDLPSYLGGAHSSILGGLFALIWIVVIINVMNFFDGLDGLAGSVSVTSATVMFIICLRLGFVGPAVLAIITGCIALGYLPWNWFPSKIVMGTVGSQLLGFLLAVVAIVSGAKLATAFLVLGIPILDSFIVILRRLKAGVSPFQADQRHLHHRLLHIGVPTPWVAVIVAGISGLFGMFALSVRDTEQKGILVLLLISLMILLLLLTFFLEQRAGRRVD